MMVNVVSFYANAIRLFDQAIVVKTVKNVMYIKRKELCNPVTFYLLRIILFMILRKIKLKSLQREFISRLIFTFC